MARPSGQNTMKPITIRAMVAGVHAGRISADVLMFSRSFRFRQPHPAAFKAILLSINLDSSGRRPKPDKSLKIAAFTFRYSSHAPVAWRAGSRTGRSADAAQHFLHRPDDHRDI